MGNIFKDILDGLSTPEKEPVKQKPTGLGAKSNFGQAFAEAREEQGSGGEFEYKGKSYTTNFAEENTVAKLYKAVVTEQIRDDNGNTPTVPTTSVAYSSTSDDANDLINQGYYPDKIIRDSMLSGRLGSTTPRRSLTSSALDDIENMIEESRRAVVRRDTSPRGVYALEGPEASGPISSVEIAVEKEDETTSTIGLMSQKTAPRPFTALEIEQAAEMGVIISNQNGLPADENGDILKTNAVTDFFSNLFSNPLKVYTKEYADVYLKEHEGVVEHDSLEDDTTTAAFGVKFSKGLKRKDYKSDAEFAAAVALKHKDIVKDKFKDKEWEALPDSVKYALVDLNFNVGKIGTTADKTTTEDMLLNTLSFVGMTTEDGTSASLIALAKRRAWNWNKASAETGLKEIAKIEQKQTANGGTEIKYLDAQGNIIRTVTNGRKPVKLNTDGTYTTITAMREVELKTNATDDDTVVAETTTNVEVQSGDTMSAIAAKNSL